MVFETTHYVGVAGAETALGSAGRAQLADTPVHARTRALCCVGTGEYDGGPYDHQALILHDTTGAGFPSAMNGELAEMG